MNSRSLSLLLFCNLIWSVHPVLGKIVLQSFDPTHAALLRYGSAMLAYFFVALMTQFRPEGRPQPILVIPRSMKEAVPLLILGAAPFAFSPILQLQGLSRTQAVDNAILIAIEPLTNVVLAWMVLGERLHRLEWLAFGGAIGGFLLLSQAHRVWIDPAAASGFLPHLLIFTSLWGEAAYSVFGRKLVQNHSALPLYGTAITIGALLLMIYAALHPSERGLVEALREAHGSSLLALLYLGPLGTTASYFLWMRVVRHSAIAIPALTLFIQPVFGTFFGFAFLDETFTPLQWLGACVILISVGGQSVWHWRRNILRDS